MTRLSGPEVASRWASQASVPFLAASISPSRTSIQAAVCRSRSSARLEAIRVSRTKVRPRDYVIADAESLHEALLACQVLEQQTLERNLHILDSGCSHNRSRQQLLETETETEALKHRADSPHIVQELTGCRVGVLYQPFCFSGQQKGLLPVAAD